MWLCLVASVGAGGGGDLPGSCWAWGVVTSSTQTITIELDENYNHTAQVDVDGQQALFLSAGEKLLITRSHKSAQLIHLNPNDFFSTIRIKLAEWSH